jgi:hypothetical protein
MLIAETFGAFTALMLHTLKSQGTTSSSDTVSPFQRQILSDLIRANVYRVMCFGKTVILLIEATYTKTG